MKIIVAGNRDFFNYSLIKNWLDMFISDLPNEESVEIVSGGAIGVDSCGEKYAKECGYKLQIFPADWKAFGKSAGPIRNKEMAEYADACICFWNGRSKGTKNMIETAKQNKLRLEVVKI